MKKNLMNPRGLWIMAAVLAIGMIGCKKTEPTTVPTLSTWYEGNVNNNLQFNNVPVSGTTYDIGVSGNRNWVISIPTAAAWVTVSQGSGSASETAVTVTITVEANTGDARSTTLTVGATDNSIQRSVVISQLGGDSPGGDAIYFEDLGDYKTGAEIRAASGVTGTTWPTIEQFGSVTPNNAWRRGGSLDQSGVVYTGTAQVRNSGALYDPVESSSISQAPYVSMGATYNFTIGSINLGNNTNLTLKFALQNTVSTDPNSPFTPTFGTVTPTTVHVQAGFNGTSWANLTYTVEEDGNGWYWATSEFRVPAGTNNLYINFSGFNGGATLRLEDFTLTEGGSGSEIDPDAETSVLEVSSEAISVDAAGGNATVDVTGNVAWTATVTDGAANITSGPTPTNGTGAGTITLVFPENTDTENAKTVTLRVSTTEAAFPNSYDVIFTQLAASTGTEQTATFTMSAMGLENAAEWDTQTVNGITITGALGANTSGNLPRYYTADSSLRTYVGNTLTFTGGTITQIDFTMVRNNGFTTTVGTLTAPADATSGIWTGSAESVVFTITGAQVRYSSIVVTYR